MYGLSVVTDLSPLIGAELTSVGVGLHQVQLGFSSGDGRDSSISVEGEFSVSDGETRVAYADAVQGATALLRLLGRKVDSAVVDEPGTVRVTFDDTSCVEVFDSSPEYESYRLNLAGREIVV